MKDAVTVLIHYSGGRMAMTRQNRTQSSMSQLQLSYEVKKETSALRCNRQSQIRRSSSQYQRQD